MPRNSAAVLARPPSPDALHRAMVVLRGVRETLIAIDPDIAEDERLFADMLDAEGGNALDVLVDMVRWTIDTDDLAEVAATRKADISDRLTRYRKRVATLRKGMLETMQALDLRRIEREDFTLTVGNGRDGVRITEPADVPDEYCRITREPNLTSIGEALRDGKTVQGAVLSNGGPSLIVRTR